MIELERPQRLYDMTSWENTLKCSKTTGGEDWSNTSFPQKTVDRNPFRSTAEK